MYYLKKHYLYYTNKRKIMDKTLKESVKKELTAVLLKHGLYVGSDAAALLRELASEWSD